MTITFYAASENHKPSIHTVQCLCVGLDGKPDPNCHFCDENGFLEEFDTPELNLANTNARAMLDMIGVDFDHCGSIEPSLIPELRRNILKLVNVRSLMKTRPTVIDGQCISIGINEDYIERNLLKIDQIFVYCQKHNECFQWG